MVRDRNRRRESPRSGTRSDRRDSVDPQPERDERRPVREIHRTLGNQAARALLRDRPPGQPGARGSTPAQPAERGSDAAGSGFPPSLRRGLEGLSGVDLSAVRVHYDSPKPAEIGARAYARGREIFVGPGQEGSLPHEGWHVVQQLQGRVAPTDRTSGVPINDDPALEREAERMGATAARLRPDAPRVRPVAHGSPRRTVQRDRDPDSDTPTWEIPDVYGSPEHEARTQGEAMYDLLVFTSHLGDVQRALDPESDAELIAALDDTDFVRHITSEVFSGGDVDRGAPLTAEQVGWLDDYADSFTAPYAEAERTLRTRARAQLEPIRRSVDPNALEDTKAELAEKLHELYITGASESAIETVATAISKIDQYRKTVDRVLGHAGDISRALRTEHLSDVISRMQGYSRELGSLLETVGTVADIASSLDTLLGGSGAHGAHDTIARFRAGIDAIDAGMGLTKAVPVLGQLWSNYYEPMTSAILDKLDEIATLSDLKGRLHAAFLIDQQERTSEGAPRIPEGYEEFFPGGQPVLDFMWNIVHGDTPRVTPAVEEYFARNASKFSAAAIKPWGKDELETSSSTWWPFDEDDEVKNLVSWVRRNKETVWAQLYGNQRWQ